MLEELLEHSVIYGLKEGYLEEDHSEYNNHKKSKASINFLVKSVSAFISFICVFMFIQSENFIYLMYVIMYLYHISLHSDAKRTKNQPMVS